MDSRTEIFQKMGDTKVRVIIESPDKRKIENIATKIRPTLDIFMQKALDERELPLLDGYDKCPHCGASMKMYWHRLTPVLVESLVKMKERILEKGINEVSVSKELNLTKTQYNNFQKLRFHGLVAHFKDEDGNNKSGEWVITRRGNQFLRGEIEVPVRVQTFRNRIVEKDTKLVKISDVIGSTPYLEERDDFQFTIKEV